MEVFDVIRRPLVTEKSNIGREEQNLVTLAVNPAANKHEIQRAVEEIFSVQVISVRTMRMPRMEKNSCSVPTPPYRRGRFIGLANLCPINGATTDSNWKIY